MGVQDQPLALRCRGAEPAVGQYPGLVAEGAADGVLVQVAADPAVVAEHDAVRAGLLLGPPVGLVAGQGASGQRTAGAHPAVDHPGHAERGGPGVHGMGQPVGVAEHREPVRTPGPAPGVLHDKAVAVEADQGEGMATAA